MASKRCSQCSINWPLTKFVCHVCGSPTFYLSDSEPDEDWKERMEEAAAAHRAEMEAQKPIELISEIPALARERILRRKGQPWIDDDQLKALGYDRSVGTIIRVAGKRGDIFFELAGHATYAGDPSWGTTEVQLGWWLIRVDVEGWVPDAPPEA